MISEEQVTEQLDSTIDKVDFAGAISRHSGKVRESFELSQGRRAIVVTDRVSAFDFVLGTVPFKGQVLNQISAWWFDELDKINIPHHFLSVPHSNISVVKNAKVLPIEIIVRGYLTGSTKTSSWYAYQNLDRNICGIIMPEGMVKNEKFDSPIITPTTKPDTGHDEAISKEEILEQGLVTHSMYKQVEAYALKMFAHGQKVAAERGLILVDTKYEMGIDEAGDLMVIDEVHTPDSSRYWIEDSYAARLSCGQEPESLDKEFVRSMMVKAGYDVDSDEDPQKYMTDKVRIEAAKKYMILYEKMTGKVFEVQKTSLIEEILERL
ncbi:phosphoribosylaminoimidazolesuccinocarboxamide synthase [Candidatus Gracilibacteria bacterium]|nr:phosphoribosylaminoimidazolesuccinocarboxamide synthase [Candidatus Gracilibacteria bacterium]